MLHRFPGGVDGKKVHQKRVPSGAPDWLETVRVTFPRFGRTRRRAVRDRAGQRDLGGADVDGRVSPVELAPRRRRATRRVADRHRPDARLPVRARAAGGRTSPTRCSTSSAPSAGPRPPGGNGIHVYVRIEPRWGFGDVRRAALAFAREVERRAPADATTTWWRKDREPDKAFVDYNQNARDHTIACAYSVRGVSEGTVSTPIAWDEIDDVEPQELTIATVPGALRPARRPARRDRRRRVLARAAAGVGRARRAGRRGDAAGAHTLDRRLAAIMRSIVMPEL